MKPKTESKNAGGAPVALHDLVGLPVYESNATDEEKAESLSWYMEQYKLIKDQHKLGTPALFVKIRCGCNKLVAMTEMYRCLYCGVWFCKECAQLHFGKRVPESFVGVTKQPNHRI